MIGDDTVSFYRSSKVIPNLPRFGKSNLLEVKKGKGKTVAIFDKSGAADPSDYDLEFDAIGMNGNFVDRKFIEENSKTAGFDPG